MKKTICGWKELLKTANEDLKQYGYRLSVNDREERGFFKCVIYKGNKKVETYAENYYANELEDLINEAWSYVRRSAGKAVLDVARIELTQEQLDLLSDICHGYKDSNRGCESFIRPVMELEAELTRQTKGAYFSDSTYDIR